MEVEKIVEQLRDHVASQTVRVTAHAQAEMVDENITLDEVFEALGSCRVLENYSGAPPGRLLSGERPFSGQPSLAFGVHYGSAGAHPHHCV